MSWQTPMYPMKESVTHWAESTVQDTFVSIAVKKGL